MLNLFPDHPGWSLQTLRLIAQAPYGGADLFDCVVACEAMIPGDTTSWLDEWRKLGERVEARATSAAAVGHMASAMNHYFHAGAYYRQADFFLPADDDGKVELFRHANRCFLAAAKLHDPVIEPVEVPCGDERYAGYFIPPVNPPEGKWPAILTLGGADSFAEEIFFWGGIEVGRRGMAQLIVDTPGRGSSLRLKGIVSRPDYEVPVASVLDWLSARPEVDPDRIGLIGVSLAGYYGPRAAAFEKRIKAMVLWCACYDVIEDLYDFHPPIRSIMNYIVGAKDDVEGRAKLEAFTLKDVAKKITCPTLLSHGATDTLMDPQGAVRLFEAIASEDKELKMWQGEEGGAVHCNYDNWAISVPYMLDWLTDRV